MTPDSHGGWSFAAAREPARFSVVEENRAPGVDHALGPHDRTLCGIPERLTTVYRSLFRPDAPASCPRCRELALAAPTEPCAQELLHRRVRTAAPGAARDDLLAALLKGAEVALWINGPAASLAKHHARLDGLTEGAGPVTEALATATTLSLARVEHAPWRFVAVLPLYGGGRPLVARGPLVPHGPGS
jgi:hypothetical protein